MWYGIIFVFVWLTSLSMIISRSIHVAAIIHIIYITITRTWEGPDLIAPFEWRVLEGLGRKGQECKGGGRRERTSRDNTYELWRNRTILKIPWGSLITSRSKLSGETDPLSLNLSVFLKGLDPKPAMWAFNSTGQVSSFPSWDIKGCIGAAWNSQKILRSIDSFE